MTDDQADDLFGLRTLFMEVRLAQERGLHQLALFGVFAIPDIMGALASEDGTSSASKYKNWLRDNVPEQAAHVDLIYGLRCSLLHQGRSIPQGKGHSSTFFTLAGGPQMHNCVFRANGEEVNSLSVPILIEQILNGCESWMNQYAQSERVKRNARKHARYRPHGIPPFVVGVPLIG